MRNPIAEFGLRIADFLLATPVKFATLVFLRKNLTGQADPSSPYRASVFAITSFAGQVAVARYADYTDF